VKIVVYDNLPDPLCIVVSGADAVVPPMFTIFTVEAFLVAVFTLALTHKEASVLMAFMIAIRSRMFNKRSRYGRVRSPFRTLSPVTAPQPFRLSSVPMLAIKCLLLLVTRGPMWVFIEL
jgi:hypothetical protein